MSNKSKENQQQGSPKKCGIVMPISPIDGCTADHWAEVLAILKEAIQPTGFEPNLVSDADDIGIIQKRIIQNLYANEIIVCDVSAKNPNVMFELGMRLAFDKPTVIIKDDKTDYTFDTSVIEHLTYPRDLRFSRIVEFKQLLGKKISATYEKAAQDPANSSFLKSFGEFKVAALETKEVSRDQYMIDMMEEIRRTLTMRTAYGHVDIEHAQPASQGVAFRVLKTLFLSRVRAYQAERQNESLSRERLTEILMNLSSAGLSPANLSPREINELLSAAYNIVDGPKS
jgi:hypothetical protein